MISNNSGYSSGMEFDSDEDDDGPQVPVYLMTQVESLINEAKPGAMLAFDIDETLIVTKNAPSYLLTTEGVRTFQTFVHKRYKDWDRKNQLCRQLQKALKDKVLVDDKTASVIQRLQDMDCIVFALTARYPEMAATTEKSLSSVGIDFTRASPFPSFPICDQHTDTMASNGIVYCSNQDKGTVFRRFVESCLFKNELASVRAGNDAAGHKLPGEFFFVDDLYENSSSVCAAMTPVLGEELGITVSCYHYVPLNLAELQTDQKDSKEVADVLLQKQMEVFAEEGRILTNQAARNLCGDDSWVLL